MPMIASTSSRWPLPSTPAMPTISPRCTVKDDVVEQRPRAVLDDRRGRCTSSSTMSVTVDSAGLGLGQLAADHQLGELAGGDLGRAARWRRCAPRG